MTVVPKLFREIRVGDMTLKHRVVMAPLTSFRANINHAPLDMVREYYEQRASTPGQLFRDYACQFRVAL
jgi:NADPH2 dehydrogenase